MEATTTITYIGIDPSFRDNGFAVCLIEGNNVSFLMMKRGLLDFLIWLFGESAPKNVVVVVENSNLQNMTFDMEGSKSLVAAKSRNVGANQAASQYTEDICVFKYGRSRVYGISPKEKGRKRSHNEILATAKYYGHTLSNYKGLVSEQDKRDAYTLALVGILKKT